MLVQVKKFVLVFWIFFIPVSKVFSQQKKGRDSVRFQKITITRDFISEGVAVADVNRDGKADILAGSFWFEAPDWKKHEISEPKIYFPDTTFSNSFLDFSLDVNQDGWPDLIRISLPGEEMTWYENPGNKTGHWKERLISLHVGNESPAFEDVDGDGRKDILCNDPVAKKVVWYKSPAHGDTTWKEFVISSSPDLATNRYTHGLGWGDMNHDGRPDLIITKGWWEHPANPEKTEWAFHTADFGAESAQIYSADLDKDGDVDLISSSAHDYGIWWHEQSGDSGKNILHHEISRIFSQSHALAFEDINGDGYADLVTGKRYYAHNGKDPGAHEPSVLYWFEFLPGKKPAWKAHKVDDDSGVGLQVLVVDMNRDGRPDVLVSNKKGLHLFLQIQ